LWFLWNLLSIAAIFGVGYLFKDIRKAFAGICDNNLFKNSKKFIYGYVIILSLLFSIAGLFYNDERWEKIFGIFTLQPVRFILYVFYFYLGVLAKYKKWFSFGEEKRDDKMFWMIAAIISAIIMIIYKSVHYQYITQYRSLVFVNGFIHVMVSMNVLMFMIHWFRSALNRPVPFLKKHVDNSFCIYIIHLPVVLALQYNIRNIDISPFIKFGFVFSVAYLISFILSEYLLRKMPLVRNVL